MTKEELGQLYPIIIKPFNREWKTYFQIEKNLLKNYFCEKLRIEHICSNAIDRISSKPTIDLLMEQPSVCSIEEIIQLFEASEYIYMQE